MTVAEVIDNLKTLEPTLPVCINSYDFDNGRDYYEVISAMKVLEDHVNDFAPDDRATAPKAFVLLQ